MVCSAWIVRLKETTNRKKKIRKIKERVVRASIVKHPPLIPSKPAPTQRRPRRHHRRLVLPHCYWDLIVVFFLKAARFFSLPCLSRGWVVFLMKSC